MFKVLFMSKIEIWITEDMMFNLLARNVYPLHDVLEVIDYQEDYFK